MKLLFLSLLMLCFIGIAPSCKKKKWVEPKAELPPITQEGKHTFGFMFGNEVWIPKKNGTLTGPALRSNYSTGEVFHIICYRGNVLEVYPLDYFNLEFTVKNLNTGEYKLNSSNFDVYIAVLQKDNTRKEYELQGEGKMVITRWDVLNKIASATFSFDVKDVKTGEIIHVSQGRFDLKLE